jgi:putative intracellular protease/amidase
MRILIIILEDDGAGSAPLAIDRFLEPYNVFRGAGADIVLTSAAGGRPITGQVRAQRDSHARDALAETLPVTQVYPEDFDGAHCIGPVPPMLHVRNQAAIKDLLAALLAAGKPVAMTPWIASLIDMAGREGLLLADGGESPVLAARLLVAALNDRPSQL